MKEHKFDVLDVKFNGSKLIEASAGTGKTFSVGILVLRLILEKKIPVEKILMVTFTKAAVAELENRIRKYVRLSNKYITGKIDLQADDKIKLLIDGAAGDVNLKKELLNKAEQSLDSLSVMTIHSFCQMVIGEFTFETGQSFDFDIVTDDSDLLKNEADKYLREDLNIMNLETFRELRKDLKFEKLPELLRKHVLGMNFIDSVLDDNVTIDELKQTVQNRKVALDTYVRGQFKEILNRVMGKNALKEEANIGNVEEFKRRFRDQLKKPAAYFANYDFMTCTFQECENQIRIAENDFVNYFYIDFFRRSEKKIEEIKHEKGHLSYDDQIKTVYNALSNETLIKKLSVKFSAVFIDEFQDTDSYQYKIFRSGFKLAARKDDLENNFAVFYIGDPKQSIYGWRGADLDTYKEAKRNVPDDVFTMNTNYRSTKKMIEALNTLLNPGGNFDLFKDSDIRYKNVEPGAADLGLMTENNIEVVPITIWKFDADDNVTSFRAVAKEIYRLLAGDFKIKDQKLFPQDIGVLVRDNWEGNEVKKALGKFNIPAVKRDNAKVLESDESRMIQYLLKAVISPGRGAINRCLLSRWFGYNSESIGTIDDNEHIDKFIELKHILMEEGIFNMISSFLTFYGVRAICVENILGLRVITNINHIAEILHKVEKQFKYTPEELLVWMARSSENGEEEYEQRIESDEDAVQISTIHKAKGLEYKVVFAPSLCMIPRFKRLTTNNVNQFKRDGKYYFTFDYPNLSDTDKALHELQNEQENRRLIYVALTRSVYKCYISYMPRTYYDNPITSSMDEIMEKFVNDSPTLIQTIDLTEGKFNNITGTFNMPEAEGMEFTPRPISTDLEIKNTFGIHSFSALSKAHHSAPFEKKLLGESGHYDQFIFQDLGRGASVGTALHSIFERLDFNNAGSWDQTLQDASKYYPNIIKSERIDLLRQLINHVMDVELSCDGEKFALNQVKNEHKLPELEFCFSLNKANKVKINELLGDEADLTGEVDIEGLMTGFIDLFFRHNDKYYILDWKSNFLGNNLADYNQQGLSTAMKENNYNLQYYIYTVAMSRWLKNSVPGFDYEKQFGGIIYLFLRGVRSKGSTGIFFSKPSAEVIESLEQIFSL